jgi:hypothetical protein
MVHGVIAVVRGNRHAADHASGVAAGTRRFRSTRCARRRSGAFTETGQVLVKVAAAGVNNTDINTRIGWYAPASGGSPAEPAVASSSPSVSRAEIGWSGDVPTFPRIQGADAAVESWRSETGGCGRIGERIIVEPVFRDPAMRWRKPCTSAPRSTERSPSTRSCHHDTRCVWIAIGPMSSSLRSRARTRRRRTCCRAPGSWRTKRSS